MTIRNNNIDFLKVILAFLVIALHIFPVSKLVGWQAIISYEIANGITRIAVPTFFLISGYFLRNKLNNKLYLWKYTKRILLLYVIWQLIYLPDLFRFYNLKWFSTTQLFLKLVHGYWHLWYLLDSVLALGMLYFTRNYSLKTKWILILLLFLFGYGFQIATQSGYVTNKIILNFYEIIGTTRNFLFLAFPMMLLGNVYDSWKKYVSKWKFFMIPLFVFLLLETYFYFHFKVKAMDFLLFLFPFCMLLFCVVESKTSIKFQFPSSLSLGIYLCHPYAIRLVYQFLPQKAFEYIVLKYFLISILAIIFWWIIERINRKWNCLL